LPEPGYRHDTIPWPLGDLIPDQKLIVVILGYSPKSSDMDYDRLLRDITGAL
jgi:hypothetical protein